MPAPAFFRSLGLFVAPNFLDPECAAEFCRQMAVAPTKKALIVGAGGEGRLDVDSRKVDCSILPEDKRTPLRLRLRDLLPELQEHFGVSLAGCEPPEYLIYQAGDFFKPHLDCGGPKSRDDIRRRRVSAVIFLNRNSEEPAEDAYGEGHLTFYGLLDGPQWEKCALPLNAEPGLLIAFPSDKWHEVKPVSHGRRFTVATWFYAPDAPQVAQQAD